MLYPCTRAMVSEATTLKPDNTVEEALKLFEERNIRNVPVVDDKGEFLGLFGLRQIVLNLLPKAATMEKGLDNLNFVVDAAPGIAKRLRKLHPVTVGEIMNADASYVHEETSTIEALRVMSEKGSPVVVVEKDSKRFKGIISRKTLLANLYEILDEIEKESDENAA